MRLQLVVLTLLILNVSSLWARELVIISDLDETLRIANVEKKMKAGIKLIGGVKAYQGLSAIFQEIKAKNPDAKFYYLSNSFPFLYQGKRWVRENNLPEGVVYQRSLKDKSASFKPQKLNEINQKHAGATFMLFGDNVERDPVFYENFVTENQITDHRIFIRDALLVFPQSSQMTYFQTEAQLIDDLNLGTETTDLIKRLSFSDLVPKFLLKNLKKRLVQECKTAAMSCEEAAEARVQEVITLITP